MTQPPYVPTPGAAPAQYPQGVPNVPIPGGVGGVAASADQFNWGELMEQAGAESKPLPVNDYVLKITAVEMKKSSTDKQMFAITFKVQGGEFDGRTLWGNLTVSPGNNRALAIFFQNMAAIGLDGSFFAVNPAPAVVAQAMVDRVAVGPVKQKEYPAGSGIIRNEVGILKPVAGGTQMIGNGFPGAVPQMQAPQTYAPQPQAVPQAAPQAPPPQYAASVQPAPQGYGVPPQQMPPEGMQYMTSSTAQPEPVQPQQQPAQQYQGPDQPAPPQQTDWVQPQQVQAPAQSAPQPPAAPPMPDVAPVQPQPVATQAQQAPAPPAPSDPQQPAPQPQGGQVPPPVVF